MPESEDGDRTDGLSRRQLLRWGSATVAGGPIATSVPTPVAGQSGGLDDWFEDVSNYDGIVDRTDESEVTVTVGASGNGGNFAFNPPAVRVDPGTTVVWEWTGKGGRHNVVSADDGPLESDLASEKEYTYSHTFDEEGVYRYVCEPHRALGMKGAVVIGDVSVGSGSGGDGAGDTALFPVFILRQAAAESPIVFLWYTLLSIAGFIALLPEISAAPRVLPTIPRVVGDALTRAGYRVKRPVLFRRRLLGSMLVGWATFLVVLLVLGVAVVALWAVSGGGVAFVASLAVLGAIVVLYAASSTGVGPGLKS